MGQSLSQEIGQGHISHSALPYLEWPLNQVKELMANFKKLNCGFYLVKPQLHAWLHTVSPAVSPATRTDIDTLFDLFDTNQNGRVDALEFLGGISMVGLSPFDDKIRFCFELFDFNMNGSLSVGEMTLMARSIVLGVCKIFEIPEETWPLDVEIMRLVEEAYRIYDKDRSQALIYPEFISWARGHRTVLSFVDSLPGAKRRFTPEISTDGLKTRKLVSPASPDAILENNRPAVNVPVIAGLSETFDQSLHLGDERFGPEVDIEHGITDMDEFSSFDSRLELGWIHGFSSQTSRNCVKCINKKLIYPAGNVVVVYNSQGNNQIFYRGHDKDILKIDVNSNDRVIASIQKGFGHVANGNIHIWNTRHAQPELISELKSLNLKNEICNIKFSINGVVLAAVEGQSEKVLRVWDWRSKQVLVSIKLEGISAVCDLNWSSDSRKVLICGLKKLQVFRFHQQPESGNLRHGNTFDISNGNFTCAAFVRHDLVAGTSIGEIHQYRNGSLLRIVPTLAPNIPLNCLTRWSGGLIGGGEDGSLKVWDFNMEELPSHNRIFDGGITSLFCDETGHEVTVSTTHGNIFQFDLGTENSEAFLKIRTKSTNNTSAAKKKVQSHFGKHLLGLAAHPNPGCGRYATCGDDGYIKIWENKKNTVAAERDIMLSCFTNGVESKQSSSGMPSSLAFSTDGSLLAIGCNNGRIMIVSAENLQDRFHCAAYHSKSRVDKISFSPSGSQMAVVNRNCQMCFYDISKQIARGPISEGNSSSEIRCGNTITLEDYSQILAIDWSTDSKYIRISGISRNNKGRGKRLMCWDVVERSKMKFGKVKNAEWYTHTCADEGGSIESTLTCQDKAYGPNSTLVAKGYTNGRLRISSNDCDTYSSCNPFGNGVRNLKFMKTGVELVIISNNTSFSSLWNVIKTSSEDLETKIADSDDDYDSDVEDDSHAIGANRRAEKDENGQAEIEQWKEAIVEPLSFSDRASDSAVLSALGLNEMSTDPLLQFQHIHGINAVWNGVKFVGTQEELKVLYPAASLSIIQPLSGAKSISSLKPHRNHIDQQIYKSSGNKSSLISSIAVAKNKSIFVSGESRDENSHILVWDFESRQLKATLDLPSAWKNGSEISRVAISDDGEYVVAIGNNDGNSLAVYKWSSRSPLIGSGKCGNKHIMGACFTWSSDNFVTCGVKHLTLWKIGGSDATNVILPSKGVFGKNNIIQTSLCVDSISRKELIVTGMMDGSLYFWEINNNVARVQFVVNGVHQCPVTAISIVMVEKTNDPASNIHVLAGGKDGKLKQYSLTDGNEHEYDPSFTKTITVFQSPLRSLDCRIIEDEEHEQTRIAVAALKNNSIHLVSFKTQKHGIDKSRNIEVIDNSCMLESHTGKGIWGLAMDKKMQLLITVGDDRYVRVWELPTCKQVGKIEISGKARAVDISEEGLIAVGLISGQVETLSLTYPSTEGDFSLEPIHTLAGVQDWITVVKFSPAVPSQYSPKPVTEYLAVGSQDANIYIYNVSSGSLSLLRKLSGHGSPIRTLDWSLWDDNYQRFYLQSSSSGSCRELFFWNAVNGIRVKSTQAMRKARWSTWTSPYGWGVQGLYNSNPTSYLGPVATESSEITSCAVSNGKTCLVIGNDDGVLKLFRYPCIGEYSSYALKSLCVHSFDIANILFSPQDRYVVSIGGTDNCICVWKTLELERVYMLQRDQWKGKTPAEIDATVNEHSKNANAMVFPSKQSAKFVHPEGNIFVETSDILREDPPIVQAPAQTSIEYEYPKNDSWIRTLSGHGGSSLSKRTNNVGNVRSYSNLSLTLKWVYGHSPGLAQYVGYDSGKRKIAFAAGALVVVKSIEKQKSSSYPGKSFSIHDSHLHRISCLSVSNTGRYIATGDIQGVALIWDTHMSGVIFNVESAAATSSSLLSSKNSNTISEMIFSQDDQFAVISRAETISIYRVLDSALVATGSLEEGLSISALMLVRNDTLISVCQKYLQLWTVDLASNQLLPKARRRVPDSSSLLGSGGKTKNSPFTCAILVEENVITAHENGCLYSWNSHGVLNHAIQDPTPSGILALETRQDQIGFISAHITKEIRLWTESPNRFQFLQEKKITLSVPVFRLSCRSLSVLLSGKDGTITECDLSKLDQLENLQGRVHLGNMVVQDFAIAEGAPNLVSVSLNGVVQIWNIESKRELSRCEVGEQTTAVAIAAQRHCAVATASGKVIILSKDLKRRIQEIQMTKPDGSKTRVMSYSPDGQTLAVAYGRNIFLLETRYYAVKQVFSGHTSDVTHFDWASDSRFIQSNSYHKGELLFWSLSATSQSSIGPEAVAQVEWYDNTCPFSSATLNSWVSPRIPLISCAKTRNSKQLVYGYASGLTLTANDINAKTKNVQYSNSEIRKIRFAFHDKYIIVLTKNGVILQYTY